MSTDRQIDRHNRKQVALLASRAAQNALASLHATTKEQPK